MRLHIQWIPLCIFAVLCFVFASFGGLAGFVSLFLSCFLPFYALFSLLYLIVSWEKYAWYQSFSTNHPHKGESIHFEIHLKNEGSFPLTGGSCSFVVPGKEQRLPLPVGFLPGLEASATYTAEIACPYRGTYVAGIRSIQLSTPLGIIRPEVHIQPQIFYVLPELYKINQPVETYLTSAGSVLPGAKSGAGDNSIFEYALPLRDGMPAQGMLWKRWAATGIPSCAVYGEARSRGISVVLDLYPCSPAAAGEAEKLAAEDLLMSAAFSVVQHLAAQRIAVHFISGGAQSGLLIDSEEAFMHLYERSANIFFSDPAFPASAFSGESSAILFSTRPIEDLYAAYKKHLLAGTEPHLFLCPPESNFVREQARSRILQDERMKAGSRSLFYVADVKKGVREIGNAFR